MIANHKNAAANIIHRLEERVGETLYRHLKSHHVIIGFGVGEDNKNVGKNSKSEKSVEAEMELSGNTTISYHETSTVNHSKVSNKVPCKWQLVLFYCFTQL